MTRKNETQYWIRKKGREKFSDTSIEQSFGRMFPESKKPNPITVKGSDGRLWTMRPDRIIGNKVLIELDGRYHETPIQERKTRWRDMALTENGYRVIHVSGRLLEDKKYEAYAASKVVEALKSTEPIVRIDA